MSLQFILHITKARTAPKSAKTLTPKVLSAPEVVGALVTDAGKVEGEPVLVAGAEVAVPEGGAVEAIGYSILQME
jgi:hypothetical protein